MRVFQRFVAVFTIIPFLVACEETPRRNSYSAHRGEDHEEREAPQNDSATYDATNAVWDENERVYQETKRKAEAGDPGAQAWMRQNGALYEMARNWSRQKNEEWNRPRDRD